MSFTELVTTNVYFLGSNYVPKGHSLTYDSQDSNVHGNSNLILSTSTSLNAIKIELNNLKNEKTQKAPVSGLDIYIEKQATLLLKEAIKNFKNDISKKNIIYDNSPRKHTNPSVAPMTPDQVGFAVDPQPLGWVKANSASFYFGANNLVVTNYKETQRDNDLRIFFDFEYRPSTRPYCVHLGYRFTKRISEVQKDCNNKIELIIPFKEIEQIENSLNIGLNWFDRYKV